MTRELSNEEIAAIVDQHGRCPDGDCSGDEASQCNHCFAIAMDIGNALEPCDHTDTAHAK